MQTENYIFAENVLNPEIASFFHNKLGYGSERHLFVLLYLEEDFRSKNHLPKKSRMENQGDVEVFLTVFELQLNVR